MSCFLVSIHVAVKQPNWQTKWNYYWRKLGSCRQSQSIWGWSKLPCNLRKQSGASFLMACRRLDYFLTHTCQHYCNGNGEFGWCKTFRNQCNLWSDFCSPWCTRARSCHSWLRCRTILRSTMCHSGWKADYPSYFSLLEPLLSAPEFAQDRLDGPFYCKILTKMQNGIFIG